MPLFLALFAAMAAMSFQVSIAPVVDLVKGALGLSYTKVLLLSSSVALTSLVFLLPSGRLLDRINPIRFSLFCFGFLAVVSFASLFAKDFWPILVLRLLAGFSFAPLYTLGAQVPQIVYPKEVRNRYVSIQTLSAPISTIVTVQLAALLGGRLGFQFVNLVPLGFALLGMFFSVLNWNTHILHRHTPQSEPPKRLTFVTYSIALVWGFFSAATAGGFVNLAPQIGQDLGFVRSIAALGPVMLMVPAFFMSPFIGAMMDRRIKRIYLLIVPSFAIALVFLIIPVSRPLWVLGSILLGFSAACIPPVVFSTPSRYETPSTTGFALSVINLAGTVGVLIAPLVFGAIKDASGSWSVSMFFATFMAICIAITGFSVSRRLSA